MSVEKELYNILKNKDLCDKLITSITNFTNKYLKDNNIIVELKDEIYNQKISEILDYFKNEESNKILMLLIKEKKIKIEEIINLKPEQLLNSNYDNIIKKRELEEYKKNNKKGSDSFKCSKCGKKNCQVSQKQTRSGDEAPTTFVTCLECHHTFKFN
jgi:DNA-directed RNA polymerase subunit M/transcription elongation factor TFIIS